MNDKVLSVKDIKNKNSDEGYCIGSEGTCMIANTSTIKAYLHSI